jgi:hypothetical protein
MANGVKQRHKLFDIYLLKWQRCRDVVAGQDAIYAASYRYLPKLIDEEPSEYEARLKRTPFYNATWRTIAGFVGLLFRRPPMIEVPKKLEDLLKDVTTTGVTFTAFAQDVALEDLSVSRVGVLVDHPTGPLNNPDGSPLTLAQAEAIGLRPSMTMYKAENIINHRYEFIGNARVLTQVRLMETASVRLNEFETDEEARIRVLDLFQGRYRVRIYKEQDESQIGGEIFPLMNGKPLDHIPFYFIGPDGTDAEFVEPVLIDLVDMNLKHFQVSADYEHGCHMTGLPTPVISGYQETGAFQENGQPVQERKFYIGSTTAWVFPNADASATFLEFTGQGLQALEKNLDRKEAQMAAIGARMLAPEKSGVEAAETLAMRHSGEQSILSAIAVAVSEGLTKALETFAQWANIQGEIKFDISRDFAPFAITPQALTALLAAVQAGRISHESFFDLLKRGDLIDSDLKFEDEQARIDSDASSMPKPVGPPGAPGAPGGPPVDPNAAPANQPPSNNGG